MKISNRGYALLSVLAVIGALLTASVATITLVRSQLHYSADQISAQAAYHIAEAGIQRGLAQLDNDAATAGTAAYVYPTIATTSFGGGTYSVTLAQDSLFPGNSSRKLITATGTVSGKSATIVAHALVQALAAGGGGVGGGTGGTTGGGGGGAGGGGGGPGSPNDPCANTILWANRDAYLNTLVSAANFQLFKGDIFANRDVHFVTAAGVIQTTGANSHAYAVRNFNSDSLLVLGTPLSAQLFRGGAYNTMADTLLLLPHGLGYHFSNGANGHGETSPAPTTGIIPAPDWQEAKSDPRTVIVSPSNYASAIAGSS